MPDEKPAMPDVQYGDLPPPDWRAKHAESADTDDDTPTPAEREAVVGVLGFDPRDQTPAADRQPEKTSGAM